MFALFTILWTISIGMSAIFFYRRYHLVLLLKTKYPQLYGRVGKPRPLGSEAWFIFKLYQLLDENVALEDRRYIARTQGLMMCATLVGIAMIATVAISFLT